jgi:hypothetical protein
MSSWLGSMLAVLTSNRSRIQIYPEASRKLSVEGREARETGWRSSRWKITGCATYTEPANKMVCRLIDSARGFC